MRITIYSKVFYPSVGGVETTTRCMARELCAIQHDVTVVTDTALGDVQELSEGYRIIRRRTLFSLIREFRQADRAISKGGISALAGLASIIAARPLLIVHEMAGSPLHPGLGFYVSASNILRRIITRYADHHIAVSKACLESKSLPKNTPSSVLYNSVDPQLSEYAYAGTQTEAAMSVDVLFVGRLIKGKGVYVLLAALKRFEQAGRSLRAAIVGGGPEHDSIVRVAAELQFVQIDIVGSLHGRDLARMYRNARLVVVPSSFHPEGMGLVIAEAFTFGRPVIGSDQRAIKEVVGEAGLCFKNGDDLDLFKKLQLLLSDQALYEDLSEKARERAAEFSAKKYRTTLNNILNSLHEKL